MDLLAREGHNRLLGLDGATGKRIFDVTLRTPDGAPDASDRNASVIRGPGGPMVVHGLGSRVLVLRRVSDL
jgi:hypothetical protein